MSGRPRDPRADAAIEAAVREILAEDGYGRLSMEKVARRSGVAKTTVYRRASDKASLVFDVMFGRAPRPPYDSAEDWTRGLKELIAALSEEFTDPVGRAAMPGLIAEFSARPALAEAVRLQLLAPAYAAVSAVIDAGRACGEIGDFDEILWTDALFGAVFVRALLFDRPVGRAVTDALVETALEGIRTESRGAVGRRRDRSGRME